MEYTLKNFKIKSNWFDDQGKFVQMGAEALNLYFNLFKFRLHSQKNEYTFMTSIYHLRKETGYTKWNIYNCLKELSKLKIIKIINVRRWDRFVDPLDNSVPEKMILEIVAVDVPEIEKVANDKGVTVDNPKTDADFYISIETGLLELYKERGLNYKYYPVYCLMKKLQNGTVEKKSYMSVQKMAHRLEYDKDYLNKLIHNMNRKNVLYSDYRNNGKDGQYFEHHLMSVTQEEGFMKAYEKGMNSNISKWDKANKSKNKKEMKGNNSEDNLPVDLLGGYGNEDYPF